MKTPIVFIIFRRPETTQRVFNIIKYAKPRQLFVIADGPRNAEDREKCYATRAIINQIDWDCQIKINFADHNLGLRKRVSSGLDWVFEQVEEAIILEDDCLPHRTFFQFCEIILEKYRDDERIMHISGDNFGYRRTKGVKDSYYFSQFAHIWGWATWRRAWAKFDVDISNWPNEQAQILAKFKIYERKYWQSIFQQTYERKIPTWDYQWLYACLKYNGLCVMPYENQISNIGIGIEATNTVNAKSPLANMPTEDIIFPLHHPHQIQRNIQGERHAANLFWMQNISLAHRVRYKLAKILRNI